MVRRQYQAVAWGFMLSLLVGASFSMLSEWHTPPDESEWLSEGGFLVVVVTMTIEDPRYNALLRRCSLTQKAASAQLSVGK
jgi:hypothetical protein